jgi:urease gamma subunit
LTEAKNTETRHQNFIKLNKREALDYISKALTGESMNDAKVRLKL